MHLLRAHGHPHAGGFLADQLGADELVEHLAAQLLLHQGLTGQGGIVAHGVFGGPLVGLLELLGRDGLTVDLGHHIAGTAVGQAADAPEHEHEDDDGEGDLDAKGLGIGTDIIKHGHSEKRHGIYCPQESGQRETIGAFRQKLKKGRKTAPPSRC